jgi:hypothetical protein
VVRLHHPHEMHRISAAGKAAVSVVDVVTNRLGAGESFRADLDRAGAMLGLSKARMGFGSGEMSRDVPERQIRVSDLLHDRPHH